MQNGPTRPIGGGALRALWAGLCSVLVVVAGLLSANPVWHEALHQHEPTPASGAERHADGKPTGHADEASCAICAFAHQQVHSLPILAVAVPLPPTRLLQEFQPATSVTWEVVWPEPASRGPPAAV